MLSCLFTHTFLLVLSCPLLSLSTFILTCLAPMLLSSALLSSSLSSQFDLGHQFPSPLSSITLIVACYFARSVAATWSLYFQLLFNVFPNVSSWSEMLFSHHFSLFGFDSLWLMLPISSFLRSIASLGILFSLPFRESPQNFIYVFSLRHVESFPNSVVDGCQFLGCDLAFTSPSLTPCSLSFRDAS